MHMCVYRDLIAPTGVGPGLECPCMRAVSTGVQGSMRVQERPELNSLVR